ncbi:MAG: flagellar basal body L-ring protein FlgH [Caulobacter sp.]|nr:flagellar basal body L-ring protein FlgH [Caulobacter sp.]
MRFAALAALAFAPLAACSTVSEAVRGPELTPIGYPSALVPQDQSVLSPPGMQPQPASANSLWRAGARAFFVDQRASRVGDIMTVQIDIDDSARTQNNSTTSRTANQTMGFPHLFGLESSLGKILPGGFDPSAALETGSTSTKAGAGAVTRSEKISLTVAAVVTGVLPNGNLVIQGTQEVMTNGELRRLTVSGIVRPEDISAANTVRHTQIAEARIAYGGRGDISRVQRTPAGQAIVERFTPF